MNGWLALIAAFHFGLLLAMLDVLRYSARKMADELDAAHEEAQKIGDLP